MLYGKKPVMSPDLERQVLNAVAQYTQHAMWKKWGLHNLREQGAAILLKGPPGCGKTKIAEYLALKICRKGLKILSFADFGSGDPGEQSRQIRKFFKEALEPPMGIGPLTIFLDECEAVLWDRSRAGGDAMWMLEVIDELLVQIAKYKGLIILASNKAKLLDYALFRRLIAVIDVKPPEYEERVRLWNDKIPVPHPLKALTLHQIAEIASLQLTGAEIENTIIIYSSDCLRNKLKPTFEGLYNAALNTFDLKDEESKTTPPENIIQAAQA